MNYTEAITAVEDGEYAWRAAWPQGAYIYLTGGLIEYVTPEGQVEYNSTEADQNAEDWDSGDHPPHP
jgi:hypothetical protein